VTDKYDAMESGVELDPYGADTARSSNAAFQPRKFTSYERDANGSDEAMFRRYNRWHARFDQPDPYGGSYDLTDPQSLNRYSYVQGDPVNFIDPSGLDIGFVGNPVHQNPPVSLFDDYFIDVQSNSWAQLTNPIQHFLNSSQLPVVTYHGEGFAIIESNLINFGLGVFRQRGRAMPTLDDLEREEKNRDIERQRQECLDKAWQDYKRKVGNSDLGKIKGLAGRLFKGVAPTWGDFAWGGVNELVLGAVGGAPALAGWAVGQWTAATRKYEGNVWELFQEAQGYWGEYDKAKETCRTQSYTPRV
jgi:RHS repeat-associated protein